MYLKALTSYQSSLLSCDRHSKSHDKCLTHYVNIKVLKIFLFDIESLFYFRW